MVFVVAQRAGPPKGAAQRRGIAPSQGRAGMNHDSCACSVLSGGLFGGILHVLAFCRHKIVHRHQPFSHTSAIRVLVRVPSARRTLKKRAVLVVIRSAGWIRERAGTALGGDCEHSRRTFAYTFAPRCGLRICLHLCGLDSRWNGEIARTVIEARLGVSRAPH